jgi:hypothetical protein
VRTSATLFIGGIAVVVAYVLLGLPEAIGWIGVAIAAAVALFA